MSRTCKSRYRNVILITNQAQSLNPRVLDIYRQRANFPSPITITGTELNRVIKLARRRLEEIRENAYEHRRSWLEALAMSNDIMKGNDSQRSKTLRQLISREEWRHRYKKCQVLLGTSNGSGLKEIHVPLDATQAPNNTVQRWRSITSPLEMINHIIEQNKKQFSQARDTPLADTPLGRLIGKSADMQIADQILEGNYDATTQMAEVTRFLQSCKKDPSVQTYVQQTTPQMFKEAFGSLSEKKSSSTSGRHIGHYKAATNCPTVMEVHCRMMTNPFLYGFAPEMDQGYRRYARKGPRHS